MSWDGKVTILCNNVGEKMAGFSQRSRLSCINCWHKSLSPCRDRPCSATLQGYTSDLCNSFLPQKSCLHVPPKLLACERRHISGCHLSLPKLRITVDTSYSWKCLCLQATKPCENPELCLADNFVKIRLETTQGQ